MEHRYVQLLCNAIIVSIICNSQGQAVYDLQKTLSNGAQQSTLAFDCLSFLTGNTCADSFLPPGKVADYFGFQYLRDNTANGQGHNTNFLTFAAYNLLNILNDKQIEIIRNASIKDIYLVDQYALNRYPLLIAFREQLDNVNIGYILNQTAVAEYSKKLYLLDANITITRAHLFSLIIKSLNETQIIRLNDMVSGGFAAWSPIFESLKFDKRGLTNDIFVLVMTYCSEMFGWYAGNITSDTYFAPERQVNYFGSFFAKDAPAVGTNNYTIDEEITADKGKYLLDNILNGYQRSILTDLVDKQWNDLNGIAILRRNISNLLRLYLEDNYNDIYDIDVDKVFELSGIYGKHDGNISYYYTMAFENVLNSLNNTQINKLKSNKYVFLCDVHSVDGKYCVMERKKCIY
eukprot:347980_1